MSEQDIVALAESASEGRGFVEWFHRPEVHINRTPGRFYRPSATQHLSPGAIVQIDLGPATESAFGDIGMTLAFEGEEPRLVTEARELCKAACGFSSRWKCTGEVFVFAEAWCNNRRMSMGSTKSIGHACFPREGRAASAWPRIARAAILLRRNQIQWYNPRRMAGVYAVSPPVVIDGQYALFEEMIYIDAEQKIILGRSGPEEIGTL
ncbi:MAG: hypothetical protein ACI8RZ_003500 [Myxococcota bacterium]|jgi:hypothetical protein